MCFTEGLGSLEVSHKFLGWFPRHLPHFNQPSFLYFVYQGTLHKFALDKKVLYFEGLHFFCFSTTAQVIVNVSSSHMLLFFKWTTLFTIGQNLSSLQVSLCDPRDPQEAIIPVISRNSRLCLLLPSAKSINVGTASWLENPRALMKLFIKHLL